MGAEEKIWTNEHFTQRGLGRLLCLSSHKLINLKSLTEFYHILFSFLRRSGKLMACDKSEM